MPQIDWPTNSGCLYQSLADDIANDIRQGVYQPGQKIPSVRKLSLKRHVSISTVTQAYSLLEDRGYIYAKPQSGYFVRLNVELPPNPPPVSIGGSPSVVTKSDLIMHMLINSQQADTVNFGAAIPDMTLLPYQSMQTQLQKASRFQRDDIFKYQFSPGFRQLRIQIAQRMRHIGVSCHPDEVIITQGCTEALSLSLKTCTQQGDTIAVESPCYYGFLQMAEALGLKVIEIPTDPVTGMSIEALQFALQQWPVRLILLSTRYSNPTGSTLPQEKLQQLIALLEQHNIHAIEDDIYGDIGYEDNNQQVLKSFDTQGRVMYCSSFSKTLAPGLRVGWCLAGENSDKVQALQTINTLSGSSLPQCAVASYLQKGQYDKHLRRLQNITKENAIRFSAAIAKYFPRDTLISQPKGGFVLWVCLSTAVKATALQRAAKKVGISIMPGDVFSNTEHFTHCIRINYAIPWTSSVESAIQQLGQLTKCQHLS